jgi:hypothetical protein
MLHYSTVGYLLPAVGAWDITVLAISTVGSHSIEAGRSRKGQYHDGELKRTVLNYFDPRIRPTRIGFVGRNPLEAAFAFSHYYHFFRPMR